MRKIISCLLPLVCLSLFSFAQKDSTFFGKWQITVYMDGKTKEPTYLLLSPDSTFITSSDSTFSSYKLKASQGKWKLSLNGELILIPSDTSHETHYYEHVSGWKYKYSANEKHGIKTPVPVMEMELDVYVEKLNSSSGSKKKKKKH